MCWHCNPPSAPETVTTNTANGTTLRLISLASTWPVSATPNVNAD